MGTTSDYVFNDASIPAEKEYYYRVKAVNSAGKGGPVSLTIKLPRDVVYVLGIGVEGGGTTDPRPGIYGVDAGMAVDVRAFPDADYLFRDWVGDASGTDNPLHLVMDGDRSITARFYEDKVFPPPEFCRRP